MDSSFSQGSHHFHIVSSFLNVRSDPCAEKYTIIIKETFGLFTPTHMRVLQKQVISLMNFI